MCEAIKEYYQKTNNKIGFKPAGGINTVHDAIIYYTIVKEILGEEWLKQPVFVPVIGDQFVWPICFSPISRAKRSNSSKELH